MPSRSKMNTDENSDPGTGLDNERNMLVTPRPVTIKLEQKPDVSPVFVREQSAKRKYPTYMEKKRSAMFRNSGMKKGAILQFFNPTIKNEQKPDAIAPVISLNIDHSPPVPTPILPNPTATASDNYNNEDAREPSEVEFVGEHENLVQCNIEVISIASDSETWDENENQRISPAPAALEINQLGSDIDFSPEQDTDPAIDKVGDSGIGNNMDSSLRPANRLNVDSCEQLIRSDHEDQGLPQTPAAAGPSYAECSHLCKRKLFPEENTPEKSVTASPSAPPLKILKVYSLCNGTPTKRPHTPDTQPSSSTLSKVRKMILTWKEGDDSDLKKQIEKRNWKKALLSMTEGLNNGTIPKREYVCQLIRSTILCEGCRVAKEVQKNATEFLESLMRNYPAQYDIGKNQSTQYYKDILEKVFINGDEAINGQGTPQTINFITKLFEQVKIDLGLGSKVETSSLRLLYLVTDLICHQYEDYCKALVKLRPSLLQHLIEQDGKLEYNTNCKYLTKELFESNTYEEFCLLIKWTDLIARRLGDFSHSKVAFKEMVSHFSELCLKRNDLGLRIFMNIGCRNLSKQIFQRVIREKLDFRHVEQAEGSDFRHVEQGEDSDFRHVEQAEGSDFGHVEQAEDSDFRHVEQTEGSDITDDMCFRYLGKLANSIMFKPVVNIISQVRREPCALIPTLTFERPYLEWLKEEYGENASTSRGINMKGETKLHVICGPTDTHEADKEFEKRILSNPTDINARDNSGNTPLHDCARYNKGKIFRTLYRLCVDEQLRASQIDFMPYNEYLETPFHLAASFCSDETVEFLKGFAQSYKFFDVAILKSNAEGKLPFEMARNRTIRAQLKPCDYDYNESMMLVQDGITLTPETVTRLKTSFELKAIIAWWNKCCNHSSDVTH